MPLNEQYITSINLQDWLVDKRDGLPLAFGTIEFWEDDNRNTPKDVFELTGAPPNYTYSPLPNPLTLSGVGTVVDNDGNNIHIYYHPYNEFNEIVLYYIVVRASDGEEMFTLQGWPNLSEGTDPLEQNDGGANNQISNPQFAEVLFRPGTTLTIPYTPGTKEVEIAPDWRIKIGAIGNGSISIEQTPIAGLQRYPGNPPFVLTVTAGPNLTLLELRQTLEHNPAIWSPRIAGEGGCVASTLLVGTTTQNVTMGLDPSDPQNTETIILTAPGVGAGAVQLYAETVQLPISTSADDGTNGTVDVVIHLPLSGSVVISDVQVCGVENLTITPPYEQAPVNRQIDHLFHYYKPQIFAKPIPSYLVGWDFAMNPAQFFGDTVAASAIGANKSKYVWDQTIVFQTEDSGIGVTRHASGAITLTAAIASQAALIQYLDQAQARSLLNGRMAVNIAGFTDIIAGLGGTVSLWYTKEVNLPTVTTGTNNSIVATIDANGKPVTQNGTWLEIPRSGLGDATFTLETQSADGGFAEYMFNGWENEIPADNDLATYFAIVVGFANIPLTNTVTIKSISLCAGDIATIPAPKTYIETLNDCQRYYEKSYSANVEPATITQAGAIIAAQTASTGSGDYYFNNVSFSIQYINQKRVVAPTLTIYSPTSATPGLVLASLWNPGLNTITSNTAALATYWATANVSDINANYIISTSLEFTSAGGGAHGRTGSGWISYHYTVDARLGIVN